MTSLIRALDRLLETIGKVVSLGTLAIASIIVLEICSRLIFQTSLPWAADVASWLMCALIMLGAPWTLAQGKFVRVDALYSRFGRGTRLWIDTVLSTILLLIVCYVLIRHGFTFAERAFLSGERPASANWNAPVWLFKALVPAGAALLVLGWVRYLTREWHFHLHPEAADPKKNEELEIHG